MSDVDARGGEGEWGRVLGSYGVLMEERAAKGSKCETRCTHGTDVE